MKAYGFCEMIMDDFQFGTKQPVNAITLKFVKDDNVKIVSFKSMYAPKMVMEIARRNLMNYNVSAVR